MEQRTLPKLDQRALPEEPPTLVVTGRPGKRRSGVTLQAVGARALPATGGTLLLFGALWLYYGITHQALPRYFWWIAAVAVLVSALASAFGEWWQQRHQ